MMTIRMETINDYDEIYTLVRDAFENAEHRDGTEQDLVVRLRESEAFIPELALVAEQEGKIIGYAMFTKLGVGELPAVGLAPLAVHPDCQRQGVGTRLLKEGHRIAAARGYEASVLVGSEKYYPRLGYRPASEFGIFAPMDLPDCNFMALSLRGNEIQQDHTVVYAKEFFE